MTWQTKWLPDIFEIELPSLVFLNLLFIISNVAFIWSQNILGYICPLTLSVKSMYLKENYEPRGTDNGQGQKSEHTFKLEAIVFVTLQIFSKTTGV